VTSHSRPELRGALGRAGLVLLVAFIGCGGEAEPAPSTRPPNIVLVVGDDHGWPYYGFLGNSVVRTPHLDRLASEGVVFPYGFNTASTCKPSLRSLLTGLTPEQGELRRRALEFRGEASPGFDPIRVFETLPLLLAARGYVSLQTGKYWELTFEGGGFTHGMKRVEDLPKPGQPGWIQARSGGSGLAIGRTTLQPLWDFVAEAGDRPFFVWLAPSLPHMPHDAPPEFARDYASAQLSRDALAYYANITRFDAMLGEVIAKLDALGLRENTLIVYLSDNGWEQDPKERNPRPELGGPRGKSSMYELGFRTPVIFDWPGRIAGGRTRNDLVSTVDVFTTLLEFAGIEAPPDRLGVSLRPALEGDAAPHREAVFGSMTSLRPPPGSRPRPGEGPDPIVRFERAYYYRDATWRYIWYPESERHGDRPVEELFRIESDPREERDVSGEHPDLTAAFRAAIEQWLEDGRARTRASL